MLIGNLLYSIDIFLSYLHRNTTKISKAGQENDKRRPQK